MGDASFVQTSFAGGEWSKFAQGRFDLREYRTAMVECLNGLPVDEEAWTRRPGFQQVQRTRAGLPGRLISFNFTEAAPYNIELTDTHFRFQTGTRLAYTNDPQAVSAISTATPAEVTTSANHGWATDDTVMFTDFGVNNPLLHNRVFVITVTASNKFTLVDGTTGASIDGSTLGTFVSGNVKRILAITTPYTSSALWQTVRGIQSLTSMHFVQATLEPYVLQVTANPTSTTDATFSFDKVIFKDGPYLDPVGGGALATPSTTDGVVTITVTFTAWDSGRAYTIGDYAIYSGVNYVSLTDANQNNQPDVSPDDWEAVSPDVAVGPNGFQGTDVNRHVRLFSEPADWSAATAYVVGDLVKYNDAYYKCIAAGTGKIPDASVTYWTINTTAAWWTWGKITGLANLIDPGLAGSVAIGNMTNNGGLAASFDTDLNQSYANCSAWNSTSGTRTFYTGKNFSGASPQAISSATVWPSSDRGFKYYVVGFGNPTITYKFDLYAKASAPASATDGTLLGTTGSLSTVPSTPVTITSSDDVTTWNYVWVTFTVTGASGINIYAYYGEIQMFAPQATTSAAINVQILGDALGYTAPIRTWRMGLYSNTTGWPTCGTYHDGRIWFSGVVDNRVDACYVGGIDGTIINMRPTEKYGTVTLANAISATFDAPDVNPIFWMLPVQQGILCGTQAGEWLVRPATESAALGPTNITADRVTRIGCANIEPAVTDHTVVFVQEAKRAIQEYFADVFSGKFASPNLTGRSKHLTKNGLAQLVYQAELASLIWATTDAGELRGCTYHRQSLISSNPPEMYAWHKHTHGAGRTFQSMAVGPATDTINSLSVITYDASDGYYYLETLTPIPDDNTTLFNCTFVDAKISPSFVQQTTVSGEGVVQCGGLNDLEGRTVTAFIGGLDVGDYTVSGGVINVPYGSDADGLFTSTYVTNYPLANIPVKIGFAYVSQGQIVRPVLPQETGARSGTGFAKIRREHFYGIQVVETKGLSIGTDFAKVHPALFRTSPHGGVALTALQTRTGVHVDNLDDDSGYDGMLCWKITRPYPATLTAVAPSLQTQDF